MVYVHDLRQGGVNPGESLSGTGSVAEAAASLDDVRRETLSYVPPGVNVYLRIPRITNTWLGPSLRQSTRVSTPIFISVAAVQGFT
jgi:hypothetical protein